MCMSITVNISTQALNSEWSQVHTKGFIMVLLHLCVSCTDLLWKNFGSSDVALSLE